MTVRVLLILVPLLAAGCAAPQSGPSAPLPLPLASAAPLWLPWNLSGCRELAAFFEADSAAVKPYFPAGFEPGAGQTPATTTVGMDAFLCKSGSGLDGDVANPSYASFWATATPPQALRGDVKQWYVKWLATVADPASLQKLKAANSTVTTGTVKFADTSPLSASGTVATIDIEGVGTVTITVGAEAAPPAPGGGGGAGVRLREYTTGGPDGKSILTWEATLTRPTQMLASGVLDVPADSILAKIRGSTRIPVVVADGSGGGLANGTITMGGTP